MGSSFHDPMHHFDFNAAEQKAVMQVTATTAHQRFLNLDQQLTESEKSGDRGGNATAARDLFTKIHNLDYQELREFIATLRSALDVFDNGVPHGDKAKNAIDIVARECRFSHHESLGESIGSALGIPNNIRSINLAKMFIKKVEPEKPIDVADALSDILLVTRMIHPLGVNLQNSAWENSDAHPTSIDASQKVILAQYSPVEQRIDSLKGYYSFTPMESGAMQVEFIPPGASSDTPGSDGILLNPGEEILLGRPLRKDGILKTSASLSATVDCPVDTRHESANQWSRGSLQAILIPTTHGNTGGKLFLLDRGTRNQLCTIESHSTTVYRPDIVIQKDGSRSFGNSIRGYPQDSSL